MQLIFVDEKLAKQVLNAAKRVSKKRPSDSSPTSPTKQRKISAGVLETPAAIEESLALPFSDEDDDALSKIVVLSCRAPLVLAFTVTLLKYTMPTQPLSSRLSLAQATMSIISRTKALSLGMKSGNSAEEDGWGHGQPSVPVMGRNVKVLKRWGYDPTEDTKTKGNTHDEMGEDKEKFMAEGDIVAKAGEGPGITESTPSEPPLWGLDLEALRSANSSTNLRGYSPNIPALPIYTPQSARGYLMRSFSTSMTSLGTDTKRSSLRKPSSTVTEAGKEESLASLLRALELLFDSWAPTLSKEELDKRAWAWYVHTRPEIQNGVAGWSEKGEIKLASILALRRTG